MGGINMSGAANPWVPKSAPGGDELTEEEAAKRRDEALKRALNTPPKPHKEKPNEAQSD